ncbi:MAG TPA: hypothetical protein VFY64_03360 [Nitrososphaeraceae archaeon]|nr:hypothetical protein [Nitrososphaeraceae archaeon]
MLLEKSINIDLHHETFRHTYTVNGILRDVGDVTNNGVILTNHISRGLLYGQGQVVLKSTNDGETATYTFQFIGSLTNEGQQPHGSWYIYTNSTEKMAFLNNMVGITKGEIGVKNSEFSTKV